MKTRAHQTLKAQLGRCAFIAVSLFGLSHSLHAKESSGMQWTVTRHTWGEDLSGSLQGAGGIGGLLRSTAVAATEDGKRNAEHEQTPAEHTFLYDSNGNVILLTDTQGQESARYAYDAFGKTLTATGSAAKMNWFRFSTKPVEAESGLVYYGYRYYDTVTGRWPSRDPIGERGGINIYVFEGSAVNALDVLGLFLTGCTPAPRCKVDVTCTWSCTYTGTPFWYTILPPDYGGGWECISDCRATALIGPCTGVKITPGVTVMAGYAQTDYFSTDKTGVTNSFTVDAP